VRSREIFDDSTFIRYHPGSENIMTQNGEEGARSRTLTASYTRNRSGPYLICTGARLSLGEPARNRRDGTSGTVVSVLRGGCAFRAGGFRREGCCRSGV